MGEKQIFFQAIKLDFWRRSVLMGGGKGRSHSQGPRHSKGLRIDLHYDWKRSRRLFTGIDV